MATKKSAMAEKIKNDPAFERTRENMTEFSRGGKAAKLLRMAFREILMHASDKEVSTRLTGKCMEMLATDPVNGRGERTVGKGEIDLLRNFNFNQRIDFMTTFFPRYTTNVDRVTGKLTVSIPGFVPKVMVIAPRKTTHFVLSAAAVAIDFDNDKYDHALLSAGELGWNSDPLAAFDLSLQLPPNSPFPFIIAMGIEFFQKVNTRMYILKSGEFNTSAVVEVNKPVI